MVMLVTLWTGSDAAPAMLTDTGYAKPPDPPAVDSDVGGRSETAAVERLKPSPVMTSPAGAGQTRGTAGGGPSRRAQMLKLLSGLEQLHRAVDRSRTTLITLRTRANGKTSGKKSKTMTAEDGVKTTTAPSVEAGGTASRASTDRIDHSSLTGRAFKKSLPPQTKKPNKRVCFWKYCSQN